MCISTSSLDSWIECYQHLSVRKNVVFYLRAHLRVPIHKRSLQTLCIDTGSQAVLAMQGMYDFSHGLSSVLASMLRHLCITIDAQASCGSTSGHRGSANALDSWNPLAHLVRIFSRLSSHMSFYVLHKALCLDTPCTCTIVTFASQLMRTCSGVVIAVAPQMLSAAAIRSHIWQVLCVSRGNCMPVCFMWQYGYFSFWCL